MTPKGWEIVRINDVVESISGGTPSRHNKDYWGGQNPWISAKDLKQHYITNSIDTLTELGFKKAKKAPKGSTLILVRGMTLLKDIPIGYVPQEVAFNQDIRALIPIDGLNTLFFSYLLKSEKVNISRLVSIAGHGTGRLENEALLNHNISLPPVVEQQKIADILSTWDQAIATTEQLIANSQQQKKALMQQLLTGKKRLRDGDGKRFTESWEESRLFERTKIAKGKALSSKNIVSGCYPVIAGGRISPYQHNDYTHENVVTISASGAYAGYVSYHPYKIWASDCSVIRVKNRQNIRFIYYLLSYNQNRLYSLQSGGAQPHVYPKDVENLLVSVPENTEQKAIADVLQTADQQIQALQDKRHYLQQEKKALMQQLLTGKKRVRLNERPVETT